MKLATSIGDFGRLCATDAERVRAFEGTGFTHLDYSFYNVLYPGSPFMEARWMDAVLDAEKEAQRLGFDFVQAHSPGNNPWDPKQDFGTVVEANCRAIAACGHLGIPNIVVHSAFGRNLHYPADRDAYFAENLRFYQALYPTMEKYHVRVLIENSAEQNMGSNYFFMTGQEMADFIDYCGHPLLGACWDVGHANMRGVNQYDDMTALGKRLCALHIQDNFGTSDQHIAPFMGTLDIDAVMHALMDIGYTGCFTFECDNMLSGAGCWPCPRNAIFPDGKLAGVNLELRRAAAGLLYQIGKTILTAYDCFED